MIEVLKENVEEVGRRQLLCAALLLGGIGLAPAHGQEPATREQRLAADQQQLRDRIARLESSGDHDEWKRSGAGNL